VGFVVNKVALGQVFSKHFGFPFQSAFHQLLHNHHHLFIWGWYNRPIVVAVLSGLSLTPLRIIIKNGNLGRERNKKIETDIRTNEFGQDHVNFKA
jgi:hypothetical protein